MTGDASKVMKFLVETMKEDEELLTNENATPPKEPRCLHEGSYMYRELQVTEQQMISEFVRCCGIGRGSKWKGVIIMPTSVILKYMRDILTDALHLQLELGDVKIMQSANSTIVVKWLSGEELRLEACHCAMALHHLRGCHYSFLGFVHPEQVSDRTRVVAKTLLRPWDGKSVTIYEA